MNLTQASSFNEFFSNILIEELYRNKIDTYFISPGSRSTPLTSSVAKNDQLTKYVHLDERGAAFAALGYARATGKPAVLICTSGSAGANYFPAICEASEDSVPMIIITADRPPELHNVLANQTMNQKYLYGEKVRDFLELTPPDKNIDLQQTLLEISSTIQDSFTYPNGPVHINCMFREPLEPSKRKKDFSKYTDDINHWIDSDKPFLKTTIKFVKTSADTNFDSKIPTILIAGELKTQKEANAVVSFAEKNNVPIFPDIRSHLRLSSKSENLISYFDQLLHTNCLDTKKTYQVIHVGGNIVSKRLLSFIEKTNIDKYLVIHNSIDAYNPHHKMTDDVVGPIEKLLKKMSSEIKPFHNNFLKQLRKSNYKINTALSNHAFNFSEIAITRQLSQSARNNSFIYSANSLSVRLLDMFASTCESNINVIANRGLSGIDGTIASAVGYAHGSKKRGTLLIGDLAFIHDTNSLALLKNCFFPLVIVILNNNGGKLFSYLPIAKEKDIFSEYFDTPQNMTFKNTAKQYNLPYYFISSTRQFKEVYLKAQKFSESTIIEIACQDTEVLKEQNKITKELKKLI